MGGNTKLSIYSFVLCIWSKPGEFGSLEPKREHGPISDPFYVLIEISITHATNPTGSHPLTMYVLVLWVVSAKYAAFLFLPASLMKQGLCDCISLHAFVSRTSPLPTRNFEHID